MPIPSKFDENEIYLLILGVPLMIVFVNLLPKRFHYSTSTVIFLLNISLGIAVDHILAGPPLDFYDVLDTEKFELFDLVLYLFVYGPFTYIVVYIYYKWFFHKSNLKKLLFLITLTILSLGLEIISAKLHVYVYKGWHVYYSIPFYFSSYLLNFCLLHLLKISERRI